MEGRREGGMEGGREGGFMYNPPPILSHPSHPHLIPLSLSLSLSLLLSLLPSFFFFFSIFLFHNEIVTIFFYILKLGNGNKKEQVLALLAQLPCLYYDRTTDQPTNKPSIRRNYPSKKCNRYLHRKHKHLMCE